MNNISGVLEKNCCGCGACYQKCPKECITMKMNERGFLVPRVDEQLCVNCGLCRGVCPEINEVVKNSIIDCFIAKAKEDSILIKSTSGGVFSLLANRIIHSGGVVYGCAWSKDLLTHHVRIDSVNDVRKIRQSKYVQSDTEQTFSEVNKDLKDDKRVLFCGTPCQLAGLKRFIGNDNRLILVELACHGVPSPGFFQEYIKWIEKNEKKKVKGYSFRNRHRHKKGEHYQLKIIYMDDSYEYRFSKLDPYYSAFISGKTLRETCYNCKYKTKKRVGDILLADYWGCEKEHPSFNGVRGASAVICVSEKGVNLLQEIKEELYIQKSTWEKIIAHNVSLITSTSPKQQAKSFVIEELIPKATIKDYISIYMPERMKYFIKRI